MLYIPLMGNNLLPAFILNEAGIQLNDTPNIQVDEPIIEDHLMIFPETRFQIPMLLWGVFLFPYLKSISNKHAELR